MAQERESASSSKSSTERGAESLRIGIVGRPHGVGGEFVVHEPTARPGLLAAGQEVSLGGRTTRIRSRRGTGERPVIGIESVTDRDSAARLRGSEITVTRAAIGTLDDGEYLVDDLIGLAVVDGDREVGMVRDVLLLPSADVLEVERPGKEPLLVPLVSDAVRSIDAARIDITLGFLGES